MLKRTLIILSLIITLVIAIQPAQTVHGIIMTHAEMLALNAANAEATNSRQKSEGKGNGFVRALKAPFKALGRLFGGGKKDTARLQRISDKDMKKFETASHTQVNQTQNNQAKGMAVRPPAPAGQQSAQPIVDENAVVTTTVANSYLEKGRALLNEHDLNAAIAELSIAVQLDPTSGEASSLLGVAYWRKGLRDRAQTSFEAAVKAQKDDPQLLNNLGYLLYETGDYDSAAKYLKQAAKLAPDDPRILNNLALTQCERGNYNDAYKSFARALGDYSGHVNLAARLERHGQSKKAIKHLEKALALKPNSTDVLARLVELYNQEDKPEKAQTARNSLWTLRTLANAAAK